MSRGSHRPIDVRAATAADARGIAIVDVQSWQAAYQGLIADGVLAGMSVTDHERHWRERITGAPPRSDTVVLTRHAAVLGFAATGPARILDDEGEGELHALYVAPDAWGRGYGTRLHTRRVSGTAITRCTGIVRKFSSRSARPDLQ